MIGLLGNKLPLVPSLLASRSAESESPGKRPVVSRAPQVCSVCGHPRFEGAYQSMHSTVAKTSPDFCKVPIANRVPEADREKKSHKKKKEV
jgi:hypothetical protein